MRIVDTPSMPANDRQTLELKSRIYCRFRKTSRFLASGGSGRLTRDILFLAKAILSLCRGPFRTFAKTPKANGQYDRSILILRLIALLRLSRHFPNVLSSNLRMLLSANRLAT